MGHTQRIRRCFTRAGNHPTSVWAVTFADTILHLGVVQGGGSQHGLTRNSWFNSRDRLFSPLTSIINTNTVALKDLMSILVKFHL